MEVEDLKSSWKPKFTSEYSMGQYDFARLDKTLTQVDNLSAIITSTALPTLEMMQHFFAQLKNLYDNFRPIISNAKVVEELAGYIKEGKKRKRIWEGSMRSGMQVNPVIILEFVDLLDNLKTRLYEIRQIIGLGIVVKRNMTTADKIKQGVHGNKDFSNLPEA